MSNFTEQALFWNYVLQMAETLEETPESEAKAVLLEQLGTLNEAFSACTDPVENYEAYVLVKLCAAIEQMLNKEPT